MIIDDKIKTTLNDSDKDQSNFLIEIVEFNKNTKPRDIERKKQKRDNNLSLNELYEGREMVLNTFKSGTFPLPRTEGTGIKILTPKRILQRLPVTLAK